ncbi:uncharacterized protein I303_101133 [Kwoniella dejecticola CBS 10117]|uniref:Uncharacterized protein n=1 Tax=Kwoniella dejecticola CBS 10117 TaxID=1296121 RepID=A0A1A6AH37_9TREE|nr:uncharacterized protein I303_01139 [Kwoniella dejecticola CBS 10117]OBR89313.1 hypothetical protein I303_01139 [Kwoniella dejecticola CBS 10117]
MQNKFAKKTIKLTYKPTQNFKFFNRRPEKTMNWLLALQYVYLQGDPAQMNTTFLNDNDIARRLGNAYAKSLPDQLKGNVYVGHRVKAERSGLDGHANATAQAVEFGPDAKKWIQDPLLMFIHAESIPTFQFALPKTHPVVKLLMDPTLSIDARQDILAAHDKEIKQQMDQLYDKLKNDPNARLDGVVLSIGFNMVDINRHQLWTTETGQIAQSFTAETTDIHGLSGSATHQWIWDPSYPHTLCSIFFGFGAHPAIVPDLLNPTVSDQLWEATSDLVPSKIKYIEDCEQKRATGAEQDSFLEWVRKTDKALAMQATVVHCFLHHTASIGLWMTHHFGVTRYSKGIFPNDPPEGTLNYNEKALSNLGEPQDVPDAPGKDDPLFRLWGPDGHYQNVDPVELVREHVDWKKSKSQGGGLYQDTRAIDISHGAFPFGSASASPLAYYDAALKAKVEANFRKQTAIHFTQQKLIEQKHAQQQVLDPIIKDVYDALPKQDKAIPQRYIDALRGGLNYGLTEQWMWDITENVKLRLLDDLSINQSSVEDMVARHLQLHVEESYLPPFTVDGGVLDLWAKEQVYEIIKIRKTPESSNALKDTVEEMQKKRDENAAETAKIKAQIAKTSGKEKETAERKLKDAETLEKAHEGDMKVLKEAEHLETDAQSAEQDLKKAEEDSHQAFEHEHGVHK